MQYRLIFLVCLSIVLTSCTSFEEIQPVSVERFDFMEDFEVNDIYRYEDKIIWCGGKVYQSGFVGSLDTAIRIANKGLNQIAFSPIHQRWVSVGFDSKCYLNFSTDSLFFDDKWLLYQLGPYTNLLSLSFERGMEVVGLSGPRASYIFEFDEDLNYIVSDYQKEIRTAIYCQEEPLYLGYGFPIDSAENEYVYPKGDIWVSSDSCMVIGYSGVFVNLQESFSSQLRGEDFQDIAVDGDNVAVVNADGGLYISNNSGRNFKFIDLSEEVGETRSLEWGKNSEVYIGMSNSAILRVIL